MYLYKNNPELAFTIFILSKRACQKLSILLFFLKNENVPKHKELTIDCTPEEWKHFMGSQKFLGLLCPVIKDVADARKLFEDAYLMATRNFAHASAKVREVLNDDMDVSFDNLIPECVRNAIRILVGNAQTTKSSNMLNVAMY